MGIILAIMVGTQLLMIFVIMRQDEDLLILRTYAGSLEEELKKKAKTLEDSDKILEHRIARLEEQCGKK